MAYENGIVGKIGQSAIFDLVGVSPISFAERNDRRWQWQLLSSPCDFTIISGLATIRPQSQFRNPEEIEGCGRVDDHAPLHNPAALMRESSRGCIMTRNVPRRIAYC